MRKPLDKVKEQLEAIKNTVKSSTPQVNKNRRITSLVEKALASIMEVEMMLDLIKEFNAKKANNG